MPCCWSRSASIRYARSAVATVAVLATGLCVPSLAADPPTPLHVSLTGGDAAADGSAAHPFSSLARAQARARQLRGSVTVLVHAGTYELAEPLVFDQRDAGTADAPVAYQAVPGEKVILVGGRKVVSWTPRDDGHPSIRVADLAPLGLAGRKLPLLVCNGRRMPLARYPNFDPENPYGGGWAFADGEPVPMYSDVPGEPASTLHYRPRDARTWSRPAEVEVFVFPRFNWWNNIESVASIDTAARLIRLQRDCSYAIRPGDRYYFRNAREELDAPGEWWVDVSGAKLHFWPPEPGDEREVVVPVASELVRFDPGAAFITLRGMTLEGVGGEAVRMDHAAHCTLAACTVRNVGDYHHAAVSIVEGHHDRVVGCDIHDVGSHGVYVRGGDVPTLKSSFHVVENSYIHHVGLEYKHGVGVSLEGVGTRVAQNLIHDGPRMGILFHGNNLVIERNHIRHMNLETEDTGAVYTGGRDWLGSRGTVIRHNYFHDMLGFGRDASGKWVSPHFAWGVYLDDNTGGVDVIGNVVARCSRAGLHLHNGRDNLVANNVFRDNGLQQHEYSGWDESSRMWRDHFPTMVEGYKSIEHQPAWKSMRNIQIRPEQAPGPDGLIMSGNRIERNLFVWANRPDAAYVRQGNLPFDRNHFDANLAWPGPDRAVRTGEHVSGGPIAGELAPNTGFDQTGPDGLPADWQWQIHTPTAHAEVTDEAGNPALRIDAARDRARDKDNYPILVSREFPLAFGHSYRIEARIKAVDASGAKASLMIQAYKDGSHFWANWPNEVAPGPDWQTVAFTFTVPAPGDPAHNPAMTAFRARVDWPAEQGTLLLDDVSVREISMLGEWASWQARGVDAHSVVADPMFERPETDDPTLAKSSPAWALGFEPIPFDQIGPYADELRASWPIVESPGAREFPVRVPEN